MFWRLTPREVFHEFRIAKERHQDEFARDTVQAWQIVRIYIETKAKKRLPRIETLLQREAAPQTVGQMKSMLKILSDQYGIPMRQGGSA